MPPESADRRALLVLTRDPSGRASGRKAVLATAAASLERHGWQVTVAALTRDAPQGVWAGRRVLHVPLPSIGVAALRGVGVVTTRRGSLNEALFDSAATRRAVRRAADGCGADLVVADGLRTAEPALAAGRPVLLHLDDLLSERYRALAASAGRHDVLGFFGETLPRPVRPAAGWLARRLLGLESRRAGDREAAVTTRADVVALTSRDEAQELEQRTGRPVLDLPMAVDVRPPADPAHAPAWSFVFLGLLDYAPNRAALRFWTEQVRPRLDALGGDDVRLTVVGHATHDVVADDPRLRFTGYVDDLAAELRRHRGMAAPVVDGRGVKTKVLDAFSVGLPVVALPLAAGGLSAVDGMHLLRAEDADAFARAVLRLRDDPALAGRVGTGGRQLLEQAWSSEAVGARWAVAADLALVRRGTA